jgi:signal transduction histidine kinase
MDKTNDRKTEDKQESPPLVLVVDDEEWMRDACTQILQGEGMCVLTASDGQTGLSLAGRQAPDLLLVDLRLPGMDGMTCLGAVKALDPEVVGIVITGYATLEVAVEAMKAGAYDFLAKPFKPSELRAVVRRGLEHRQAALRTSALLHGEAPTADLYLAALAHQFKAPLAVLRQCVEVVLQGYAGDIDPRAKGMIEIAAHRADHMMQFVDDWLTLCRLEKGAELKCADSVSLMTLVQEEVDKVKERPESAKLSIECSATDDPGTIQADANALSELFANLLDNAVRYTPAGGSVHVEVGGSGDEALVVVRDTGPGISPEDMERIFEPFYRARAQKSIPGTGLGLPIAKRIAEAHGGRIEVETALGQGSAFRVFLSRGTRKKSGAPRGHQKEK